MKTLAERARPFAEALTKAMAAPGALDGWTLSTKIAEKRRRTSRHEHLQDRLPEIARYVLAVPAIGSDNEILVKLCSSA